MIAVRKSLGETIQDVRKAKGLTVRDAANRLNISRMTLARLEADQTQLISVDNLISIANDLEVDFFRMLAAYGRKLVSAELEQCMRVSKRLTWKGRAVDRDKLLQLIQEHEEDLYEED